MVNSLHDRAGLLTPRQREVMAGVLGGQDAKQMARAAQRSTRTVESCLYRLYRELGAHSAAQAVELFLCGPGPR